MQHANNFFKKKTGILDSGHQFQYALFSSPASEFLLVQRFVEEYQKFHHTSEGYDFFLFDPLDRSLDTVILLVPDFQDKCFILDDLCFLVHHGITSGYVM